MKLATMKQYLPLLLLLPFLLASCGEDCEVPEVASEYMVYVVDQEVAFVDEGAEDTVIYDVVLREDPEATKFEGGADEECRIRGSIRLQQRDSVTNELGIAVRNPAFDDEERLYVEYTVNGTFGNLVETVPQATIGGQTYYDVEVYEVEAPLSAYTHYWVVKTIGFLRLENRQLGLQWDWVQ